MSDKQNFHRLLERQIRRFEINQAQENLSEFIEAVNKTYTHFEKEKELLDKNSAQMIKKIASNNENLQSTIDIIDSFNYHVSHDLKTAMINTGSLISMLLKYLDTDRKDKLDKIINKLQTKRFFRIRINRKVFETFEI